VSHKKQAVKFELRDGAFVNKAKVQQYGECLWRLSEKGMLEPREVVDEARPESSPLHDHFEWDDEKAGESWRRQQARQLIRSIEFIMEPDDHPRPAFFHVEFATPEGETEQGYINDRQVRESLDFREQIVGRAKSEIFRWRNRYEEYRKEFGKVFSAIDKLPFDDAA